MIYLHLTNRLYVLVLLALTLYWDENHYYLIHPSVLKQYHKGVCSNSARLTSLKEQQTHLERELAHNTAALAEAVGTSHDELELEAGLAQLDQLLEQLQLPNVPDNTIAQLVEQIDQIHELEALSQHSLGGMPALAEALTQEQFEAELTETLLEANTAIESLDQAFTQAIQTERLETLSNALTEWRLGQELTEAISTLDEDSDIQMKVELERIGEALAQLQSLNILDPDLEQLVSVVDQWQAEQRKTETGQIAELAGQLESLHEEHLLDESGLAEKLADLTGQIERFSTIRQHEPFEGIDSLAEALTELEQEEALANSNLKTKLNELTLALKQLEARFTPTSFQGMKELAQAVSQHKANSAIAAHLAQFEQVTEQVEQMMINHPHLQKLTQVVRTLQETAAITGGIGSEELESLADSLRQRQQKAARMPKKLEAFWEPQYPSEPPRHLQPKHWEEFKQSAIHPDLVALNAQSISDRQVYERLLSEKFTNPKYGAGQYVTVPIARELKKYEQMAQSGWWGNAGIDALSLIDLEPGQKPLESLWGCYKPDNPRIDQQKSQSKGKTEYRKYENPASTKRVPFLPQVSDELAERIYQKHNVTPTEKERQSGFWYVIKQHPEIPITITEGFKKTLSSLSQGEVTIGLTGVNHIYRSKDDLGNKLPQRQLNEEVAVFAQPNREFRFAYDQDNKLTTICNVRRDLVRGIELLEAKGSTVKVVKWNSESGKGLDDLIANCGPLAYSSAQRKAIPSERDKRTHYRTEYNKLAKKVSQEMGSISVERLDLEVYIRAALKGELADGARVVGESDEVRFLREQHPDLAQHYVGAIASVAGTYGRMFQRGVRNLDELARQLVQRQTVALALEAEKALVPENAYTQKHQFGPRR